MATTKLSPVSPVRPDDKRRAPSASVVLKVQDSSAAEAYQQYLRLPELSRLWNGTCCPGWADEGLVKPALQALEITFRFVSVALSDPRGYASRRELSRRLESLAAREVELVAALCEAGGDRSAPLAELSASEGVLPVGLNLGSLTDAVQRLKFSYCSLSGLGVKSSEIRTCADRL